MLLNSVKMQIRSILHHKEALITTCIIMLFVFLNYFTNIIQYTGKDVVDMYFPMKLLLLSEGSGAFGFYFMQYYPLLVILPAGFSYMNDKASREKIYIQARVGIKRYYKGKIIAVFIVTFIVFTLPLFIEMMLSCIAFPMQATGDLSNVSVYEEVYITSVKSYPIYQLYVYNPYLYTLVFVFIFGFVSGVLSVFVNVISMCKVKYKIILFLPVYILLYGMGMFGQINSSIKVSTSYFDYLGIFTRGRKSEAGYFVLLIFILLSSFMIVYIKERRDSF